MRWRGCRIATHIPPCPEIALLSVPEHETSKFGICGVDFPPPRVDGSAVIVADDTPGTRVKDVLWSVVSFPWTLGLAQVALLLLLVLSALIGVFAPRPLCFRHVITDFGERLKDEELITDFYLLGTVPSAPLCLRHVSTNLKS